MSRKSNPKSLFSYETSAQLIARDEHENNFSSRRVLERGPIATTRSSASTSTTTTFGVTTQDLRDRHYAELTAFLAQRGCQLVAHAHYPKAGESAGYTLALIFISARPEHALVDQQAACDLIGSLINRVYSDNIPETVLQ